MAARRTVSASMRSGSTLTFPMLARRGQPSTRQQRFFIMSMLWFKAAVW